MNIKYSTFFQSQGKHYSQKVDFYALGLIFFELFYPFNTQMERIKTLIDARQGLFPARFVRELPEEVQIKCKIDF